MRRWWYVPALFIATLPASLCLWQAGYFASSDGMIHLYRLFELDRAVRAGILYPRWFPLSGYGYGLPVLNYYPPLTYYLAEIFHLAGAGYIASLKLLVALGFFVAAISMFLFAREWLGDRAAFVAGVSFAYLPYLISDAYVRGNFPEFLAMSLLPLALLAFRRAYTWRDGLAIAGAAAAFAAIICTHHLTAMLFSALLLGYLGLLFISQRDTRALLRCGAAIAIALALGAFYWLPALAELNLAYVGPASVARFIVSRLVSIGDFFAPALAYIYLPQSEAVARVPGFPQTLVALAVGVVCVARNLLRRVSESKDATKQSPTREVETPALACGASVASQKTLAMTSIFFFLVVILSLAMSLTISAPLWYAIAPLRFVQFPWRFQVLAGVGTAFLIGVCAKWIIDLDKKWSLLSAPIFSIALILLGAWNMPLRAFPLDDAQVDLTRSNDNDYVVAQMGWGWTREFVPAGVTDSESIYAPIAPQNFSPPLATPLSLQILNVGWLSQSFHIATPQSFAFSIHTFYFPGWQAYIDDIAAPTFPRGGLGLATVTVPSGEHTVTFRFEDTPLRAAVNFVSLIAGIAGMAWLLIKRRRVALALLVALVVIAAMWLWHARTDVSSIRSIDANLDGKAMLLGGSTNRSNDAVQVTLYWLALQDLSQDYTSFVHVVDAGGNVIAQHDGSPDQGLTPTTRWLPGEIVADRHNISLQSISPGAYRLTAGMYLAHDDTFTNLGNEIDLGHTTLR